MERFKKEMARRQYWIYFTIMFLLMTVAIFSVFWKNHKSLIRTADGLNQYYYSLSYYGQLLRTFFTNLFTGKGFHIPMWDMRIGYGSDILTTLNYYGIGDPLSLLSVFFTQETMEYCFMLLFFLRILLAGLFFSIFSFSHQNSRMGTLAGAVIYMFCGYSLQLVPQYVTFSQPLVYFPLVLMGVDRILQRKKPFVFIFSIALCGYSNFYFLYTISIFMFIYAVFRYFHLSRNHQSIGEYAKEIMQYIALFAGYYLTGLLLSMPVLLPVIRVFLSEGRNKVAYAVPFLYPLIYYPAMTVKLFFGVSGSYLGFSLLFLPVLILIFLRRENRLYRVLLAVLIVMMIFPAFASMLNGFAYVSERFHWGMAFVAAYLTAVFYPQIFGMRRIEKLIMAAGVVFLNVLLLIIGDESYPGIIAASVLFLIICISEPYLLPLFNRLKRIEKSNAARLFRGLPILVGCFMVIVVARSNYEAPNRNESVQNYKELASAAVDWKNGMLGCFEEYAAQHEEAQIVYEGPFRLAKREAYNLNEMNSSLISGICGMQFYFSLYDNRIAKFYDDLAINAVNDFRYDGVDGRFILLHLMDAEYLILNAESGTVSIPGFETVWEGDTGRIVVSEDTNKNREYGMSYDSYLTVQTWENMSAWERQEALAQAVYLTKEPDSVFSESERNDLDFYGTEAAITVSAEEGIYLEENKWQVEDTSAALRISYNAEDNSEIYVWLAGFDYIGDASNMMIEFSTPDSYNEIFYLDDTNSIYTGKREYLLNLGVLETGGPCEIIVRFPVKGTYCFDDVKVICQPVDAAIEAIEERHMERMSQTVLENNRLIGEITVSDDRILCLPIPYSSGWKAYVDGVETEILQANEMMLAMVIEGGTHQIVLQYMTPGLIEGILLSFVGILVCVWLYRRKSHENV